MRHQESPIGSGGETPGITERFRNPYIEIKKFYISSDGPHTHTHLEFITYRCQQNTKSTIEIVQEKPSVEPKACPRAEAGHGPESWRYDG